MKFVVSVYESFEALWVTTSTVVRCERLLVSTIFWNDIGRDQSILFYVIITFRRFVVWGNYACGNSIEPQHSVLRVQFLICFKLSHSNEWGIIIGGVVGFLLKIIYCLFMILNNFLLIVIILNYLYFCITFIFMRIGCYDFLPLKQLS